MNNKDSQAMNEAEVANLIKKVNEKHLVWHKFCDWAEKEFGEKWEDSEIFSGQEVIEKIEKYVEENPEVCIARCDDDLFAGSILVVIPHKDMGNTVLFVPQLTTRTNKFFLYPNYQKRLIDALNKNTHKDE